MHGSLSVAEPSLSVLRGSHSTALIRNFTVDFGIAVQKRGMENHKSIDLKKSHEIISARRFFKKT